MSGIFDVFGETSNAAKQQSLLGPTKAANKSAVHSTMFDGRMAGKNVVSSGAKPKGLSMRSGNDLNISNLNIKSGKSPTKKSPIKGVLKPEIGPSDGNSLLQSPRNKAKTLKMQIMRSKQLKALSSKNKSPENDLMCERKQAEENIFKKPLTPPKPTRKIEVYPDPEELAYDYDYEKDLNNFTLDSEFVQLLKLPKNSVQPYEDEGFESDPEMPPSPPAFSVFVVPLDDDTIRAVTPELPTFSDDEDFSTEN